MNKQLIVLALILVAVSAFNYKQFSDDIVARVNRAKTTWSARHNERFEGMTYEQIQSLMGTLPTPVHMIPKEKWIPFETIASMALPTNFDLRQQYPNCQSIQEVRDQSNCGSCWAFGTVEAISDRICIASGQTQQTRISSTNLLSCCRGVFSCGMGCNGGYPAGAWAYFVRTGLVTGDLYTNESMQSNQYCQPYAFPPCSHHVSGQYVNCTELPTYSTPSCSTNCNSQYTANSYTSDIHKGTSSYTVPSNEQQIMAEIYAHGSTTASFDVYEDFLTYSSGVYQHTTGSYLGGHAVKMIGWGTENGTPFWLCANSWNNSWGEQGFFKILRGQNECNIETGMVAGLVQGQTE